MKKDVELIMFKKYKKETLISVNIVLPVDDALTLLRIGGSTKLMGVNLLWLTAVRMGFICIFHG